MFDLSAGFKLSPGGDQDYFWRKQMLVELSNIDTERKKSKQRTTSKISENFLPPATGGVRCQRAAGTKWQSFFFAAARGKKSEINHSKVFQCERGMTAQGLGKVAWLGLAACKRA